MTPVIHSSLPFFERATISDSSFLWFTPYQLVVRTCISKSLLPLMWKEEMPTSSKWNIIIMTLQKILFKAETICWTCIQISKMVVLHRIFKWQNFFTAILQQWQHASYYNIALCKWNLHISAQITHCILSILLKTSYSLVSLSAVRLICEHYFGLRKSLYASQLTPN